MYGNGNKNGIAFIANQPLTANMLYVADSKAPLTAKVATIGLPSFRYKVSSSIPHQNLFQVTSFNGQ